MKILVLEDNIYRIKKFQQELIGHIVDFAATANAAIDFLNDNLYDIIFLDHDLGGKENIDSKEENTGYTVAKFISTTFSVKPIIVIHSCNPIGAKNINKLLSKDSIIVPFTNLDIKQFMLEREKIEDYLEKLRDETDA